ncbi:MAG: hypothetical protein K6F09_07405, partial [Clostridiales bacterium]|nr:hypothetical protein [Clostridiales bacterium]
TDSKGALHKDTSKAWLRNLDILAEACKKTDRDLWVIIQACGNYGIDDGSNRFCDEPEDMRQQMYASLAFGSKAVIYACYQTGWWSPDARMIDANGNRTDTYYSAKTTNDEVAAFKDLYGDYKYLGTHMINPLKVAGHSHNYLEMSNGCDAPDVYSTGGLLVGTFVHKDTGKKAYIVTNMEELDKSVTVSAVLNVPGAKNLTVYQMGKSKDVESGKVKLSLTPGEGVFITEK